MTERASVEEVLRQRLDDLRDQIEGVMRTLRPLQEEERSIDRMLREYSSGSKGSGGLNDEEIVVYVRREGSELNPLRVPEIAAGLGVDPRGLSKRLPRMARDGLLRGDPQGGYYVAKSPPVRRRTGEKEKGKA